jgi:hypothetical protein
MIQTYKPYLLLSTESTLNMTSMPATTVELILPAQQHFTAWEACLASSEGMTSTWEV